jgi:hypothetical protein
MAIFQLLAVDLGILAAGDQDESRLPTGEVFHHPLTLLGGELGESWRRQMGIGSGGGSEKRGEGPEIVGALGPGEVEAEDGHDGVVHRGGEGGDGGCGRKAGEEGGVWRGDGVCAVRGEGVKEEGVAGEVKGERQGQETEAGGGGHEPSRRRDGMSGGEGDELEGEGEAEEGEGWELLVVPAGGLEEVRQQGGGAGKEEGVDGRRERGLGVEGRAERQDGDSENEELRRLGDELEEGKMADRPVGGEHGGQGEREIEGGEAADGEEEGGAGEEEEEGLGTETARAGDGAKEEEEFESEGDEGELGLETERDGGEEDHEKTQGKARREGGCQDVGEAEEGDEVIALAEVAGGGDGEE